MDFILSPHLKIEIYSVFFMLAQYLTFKGEVWNEFFQNALTITTKFPPSTMNLGLIIKAERLKELEEENIKIFLI